MNQIDEKMKKILPYIDKDFFGNPLKNIEHRLSKERIDEIKSYPKEYKEFLYKYGSGELSSFFWIESSLQNYQAIYGREIPELEGMLVFGSDMGEYVYAFDTKNNWEVVDIDADGEIFERYGDFKSFINGILDEIIESIENE